MNNFKTTTLENGLKVSALINKDSPATSLGYFVNTGSRDETMAEHGLSHFLEHMLFKSTKNLNAYDLTMALADQGVQANAYTSAEMTVYYGRVIKQNSLSYLKILSDMMQPALLEEDFITEKKVILEEISMCDDQPNSVLYEKSKSSFYKGHSLAKSVIGTSESVSSLTIEQMRDYFNRRYTSRNMNLFACGNFDWEEFLQKTNEYTKDFCLNDITKREKVINTFSSETKEFKYPNLTQSRISYMIQGVDNFSKDKYALELLMLILASSSNSKLYWELVDNSLADYAAGYSYPQYDNGTIILNASCDSKNIDKVKLGFEKVLKNAFNFTQEEFNTAKTKILSSICFGLEGTMGQLMSLAVEFSETSEFVSENELINIYKNISLKDVLALKDKIDFNNFGCYQLISS